MNIKVKSITEISRNNNIFLNLIKTFNILYYLCPLKCVKFEMIWTEKTDKIVGIEIIGSEVGMNENII